MKPAYLGPTIFGAAFPTELVEGWPKHNQARMTLALYSQDQVDALIAAAVAEERERAARVCDDECTLRNSAGDQHPPESPARDRCYAGARAAYNCAQGVRSGEVI